MEEINGRRVRKGCVLFRWLRLFAPVVAICLPTSVAGSQDVGADPCKVTDHPTAVEERQSADLHRAPTIEGGERGHAFVLRSNRNLLGKRTIIDEEPGYAKAFLSDGSGLTFNRDCRGIKCVYLGLQTVPDADCWSDGWYSAQPRAKADEFVVYDGSHPSGMRISIRMENSETGGRLVRHVEVLRGAKVGTVDTEPLIVSARRMLGFGVSPPAIHGGVRNIDVVTREPDGSLALATYTWSVWP